MGGIEDFPKEQREKILNDIFCLRCQRSFRAGEYSARDFRGNLMIEAKCPTCGEVAVKPVSSR